MSSIDSGGTEVSPRSELTSTGKKQRTAAITIFDQGLRSPNHAFVIGAKAMIGMAFAAIAYGMSARPTGFQRARTRASRNARLQPRAKPPRASLNVNHPALQRGCRSSQKVVITAEKRGRRKRLMWKTSGKIHCQ